MDHQVQKRKRDGDTDGESRRFRAASLVFDGPQVFGVKLSFDHTKCDHGDGIGSDISAYHIQFQGEQFYAKNREAFFQCVTQDTILDAAKDLLVIILHENFHLTYDVYSEKMRGAEHIFREDDNYDLFMVASYHIIYAHTTKFFGLQDLFSDHFGLIEKTLNKFGCSANRWSMFCYDNILASVLDGAGRYLRFNETHDDMLYRIQNIFIDDFNSSIIPHVKIMASLLILGSYDLITIRSTKFIAENIKKAGCTHTIHNAAFSKINNLLGVKVNTWFENYQTKHYGDRLPRMDLRLRDFAYSIIGEKTGIKGISTLNTICRNFLSRYYYFGDVNKTILDYAVGGEYIEFDGDMVKIRPKLPWSLQFKANRNFILFINGLSVRGHVPESVNKRYDGPLAVMAKGRLVYVYNLTQNKLYKHSHLHEIWVEHGDFSIWVASLVSIVIGSDRERNRVIYTHRIRFPDFTQVARNINGIVNNIGMSRHRSESVCEWYIRAVSA